MLNTDDIDGNRINKDWKKGKKADCEQAEKAISGRQQAKVMKKEI
jgi:hypothetical protein